MLSEVRARIRYQKKFEKWFPKKTSTALKSAKQAAVDPFDQAVQQRKSRWAFRLTTAAKDDLFNMFHNKSDDFLDAVADGRIEIVGPATYHSFTEFQPFDEEDVGLHVEPDIVVPAVGFKARFPTLSESSLKLDEFYLGCCHLRFDNLFLVGFARPIIGNIPSISEMQAQYVCGLIAGKYARPAD